MAETWISRLPKDEALETMSEDEFEKHPSKILIRSESEVSISTVKKSRVSWFTNFTSRIAGAALNKVVQKAMQNPLTKYLMSPETLKKALNNDPTLRETYRIILTSEPVQKLMKPESFKIFLDSETAKKVITPELILTILNNKTVADFVTPDVFNFVWNSEVLQKVCSPEALLADMETKSVKNFLKPEVIHEIVYSPVFTRIMVPDILISFINTDAVKAVMTKDAIEDALNCPGSRQIMGQGQEMVDKLLATEGVQNLLSHQEFKIEALRLLKAVESL